MNSQRYKFCAKCGTKLTSDTQFCTNCGTKTIEEIQESSSFQAQPSKKLPETNTDVVSSSSNGEKDFSALFTIERIQKELFSYCGRLNRLAYFQRVLIVLACIAMSIVIGVIMEELVGEVLADMLFSVAMFLCAIAGTMLGIRRCHDLDKPGWFVVLAYIPVVGAFVALYIWFAPGTNGTNRYGSDPLQDFN